MSFARWTLRAVLLTAVPVSAAAQQPALTVAADFVYEEASFPSAHASTIVETADGFAAAWFGGTAERNPDVGIWLSRHNGTGWSPPVEVANGIQEDGRRHPCWNPVLFQPSRGPLLLFYKVGPSPGAWWGLVRTSSDQGRTWSAAIRLPDGVLGPIRAKPVELGPGRLLAGSSTEHDGWVVHMERFSTEAQTEDGWQRALVSANAWKQGRPLNDPVEYSAIQPTILVHSTTELQILCRSQQGLITQAWSTDGGVTWGPMSPTDLPNPSAGIDALRLRDGRFLLVYNPTTRGRRRLAVAVSDDGRRWRRGVDLENASDGEYSYPAMIQAADGLVHVTYTWRRQRIRHVVFDPARIP
ncbi:MAG: exo-alpha-sialidase [Vicinamibacterales bacterium]|jgi:predicted neuraminidase|nr:exo-alpha-sialidase [Vicinamibacterales bacterium]